MCHGIFESLIYFSQIQRAVQIALFAMAGMNTVKHERGDAAQRNVIMYEQHIAFIDSFEIDDLKKLTKTYRK